jgi:PAS domain S-box-containing protein
VVEACNDITALRQAETALRSNHDLLSSVLEGSADPNFAKDCEGRHVLLNAPAAALLGVSAQQAVGRCAADLMPPGLAEVAEAGDQTVIALGEVRVFENAVVLPEGGSRIMLMTKAPWRDAAGVTLGIVGVSATSPYGGRPRPGCARSRWTCSEWPAPTRSGRWAPPSRTSSTSR